MGTMELPYIICTVYRFFEYFEPTYVQIGQMVWENKILKKEKNVRNYSYFKF